MSSDKVFELPAYGWKPRRDQMPSWQTLMNTDFRRGSIVAHRRFGKDELGLQTVAVKAMERVGSYWYAMPEYEQARKAIWNMVNWRTQRTRIDDAFPPEIVAHRDNETMFLRLESGSTVQLIGSDRVDSLVGGGQIGIVMSEAALSNPKALQYFRPILEESGGWELQISTPRGKNHFYRSVLANAEDEANGDKGVFNALLPADKTDVFPVHQLHRIKMDLIREHGQKLGEAIFNQEYMVSFNAAVIGSVWGDELTELELEGRCGTFRHDRRFPVNTSWDLGVGDPTVILFWQDIGGRHRLIDAFESTDLGIDTYINVLKEKRETLHYTYGIHVGPHDLAQREKLRGVSLKDGARRMGLEFKQMPNTRIKTQISVGAQLLRQVEVNEGNADAMDAFEKFKAYHYPLNKATGEIVATPVHDGASHASSALMTYALYHASKLGVQVGDGDNGLGGGLNQKFDPRKYGGGQVPYGHDGTVSAMMRGNGTPRRGAFG